MGGGSNMGEARRSEGQQTSCFRVRNGNSRERHEEGERSTPAAQSGEKGAKNRKEAPIAIMVHSHIPISRAVSVSLESVRLTSTMLRPLRASSKAYALPMPSVAPVTTAKWNDASARHCQGRHMCPSRV